MSPHTIGAIDHGVQVAKSVLEAEIWMVRYLGNVIGPISLELLERGIDAGKIPGASEIAHHEQQKWRRLIELYPQLEAAPPEAEPLPAQPEAAPLEAAPLEAAPLEAAPLEAAPLEAAQALPEEAPTAPPRSARMPFSSRAYSSPPPRPVPVPASAPPPPRATAASSAPPPEPMDELPIVPPPPPVPPAPPPSYRFPEEPVSIPKQGMLAALFG